MFSFLITLIIFLIVVGCLIWIVRVLPLPAPFPMILQVLIILVALLWLLNGLGVLGGLGFHRVS